MKRRDGYAMTLILLMFAILLSIFFSGLFDVSQPQIKKIQENSLMLASGISEMKDALNYLWIGSSFPPNDVEMNLDEFSNLADRDFALSYFDGINEVKIKFQNVEGGTNVLIRCVLNDFVRINPILVSKELSGIVIEDEVLSLVLRYRKGELLL